VKAPARKFFPSIGAGPHESEGIFSGGLPRRLDVSETEQAAETLGDLRRMKRVPLAPVCWQLGPTPKAGKQTKQSQLMKKRIVRRA